MDSTRWSRAREIFAAAIELPADERARFVETACEGDEELRELLESLLRSHFEESPLLPEDIEKWRVAAMENDPAEGSTSPGWKPRRVAHFELLSLLGQGGMGKVYRALDTRLQRVVALKFLRSELTRSEALKRRLLREARAASRLVHQNICTIHEIGETSEGQLFVVMTLYEGEMLATRLARGPLGVTDALRIASQVGRGLAMAHAHGLVHRDIKPGNILLATDGEAKILDFGIAASVHDTRITQTGAGVPGTPAYMSPEHARGETTDNRSDVWSLGALLFEMLTGRRVPRASPPASLEPDLLPLEVDAVSALPAAVRARLNRVLRTALADDPRQRYQRVEELLSDLDSVSKLLTRPGAGHPTYVDRSTRRRSSGWVGGVLAVVVLLTLAVWVWSRSGSSGRKAAPSIRSLAVLPFDNLQEEPGQEYFVSGMTGALITELSRLRDCSVISHASVMRYSGADKSAEAIASELGVDVLVAGTILREGERVGISAELVDGASGRILWADRYERELRDVLALQSHLAGAIAAEIGSVVLGSIDDGRPTKSTVVPEAYDLVLKGKSFLRSRTESDLLRAADYFWQAIEIDPAHAEPYAGLAEAYFMLAFYGHRPGLEVYPRAKLNARKALALDPGLATAHSTLAVAEAFNDWNWLGAEERIQLALELSPSNATAHSFAGGLILSPLGRGPEAIAFMRRAQQLDPLSPIIFTASGFVHWWAGDDAGAKAAVRQGLALKSDFWLGHALLGLLYEGDGRYEEAVDELLLANRLSRRSTLTLSILGYVYGRAGLREEALAIVEEMTATSSSRYVSPYDLALVHAGLGNVDRAFESLERAYEERAGWLAQVGIDPRFEILHDDPRFRSLLTRMKLPNGSGRQNGPSSDLAEPQDAAFEHERAVRGASSARVATWR